MITPTYCELEFPCPNKATLALIKPSNHIYYACYPHWKRLKTANVQTKHINEIKALP